MSFSPDSWLSSSEMRVQTLAKGYLTFNFFNCSSVCSINATYSAVKPLSGRCSSRRTMAAPSAW